MDISGFLFHSNVLCINYLLLIWINSSTGFSRNATENTLHTSLLAGATMAVLSSWTWIQSEFESWD
jgi:hypothetical protein